MNMPGEYAEAHRLIDELNETFSDFGGATSYRPFEIKSNGMDWLVSMFGEALWSSEDDNREYITQPDGSESIESLSDYITREAQQMIDVIGKVRLGIGGGTDGNR